MSKPVELAVSVRPDKNKSSISRNERQLLAYLLKNNIRCRGVWLHLEDRKGGVVFRVVAKCVNSRAEELMQAMQDACNKHFLGAKVEVSVT